MPRSGTRSSARLICRLSRFLQHRTAVIRRTPSEQISKEQIFAALLQMPRRYCGACRDDGHHECVSCLGKSHAESALTETECSHCENMSLASLRSRIAFFSESDSAPHALPFSSSQDLVRKKKRGRGLQRSDASELTSAQVPRTSLSPHREDSPVLFTQPDQRPSASASDLVLFGGSDNELLDDSMSLAASDAEELSGLTADPNPPCCRPSPATLILGWTPNYSASSRKPSRSWVWSGLCQKNPPAAVWTSGSCRGAVKPLVRDPILFFQRSMTSSPDHGMPHTSARTSALSALTLVDSAEDKGYEKLLPLDKSVAVHLCLPTAIGWKAKAAHPSKPCRTTSALAGHANSSAGQAASARHSMAVLQVFQAKLLASTDESGPDPATLGELRSTTDLALRATKATAQAIGRSMTSLVVLERHLWLTLMEIKDADKVPFLDALISPSGLLGQWLRASLSVSLRHRSRPRPRGTSCQNALAPQLPRVAPSLRRLSSPRSLRLQLPPPPNQPSLSLDDVPDFFQTFL